MKDLFTLNNLQITRSHPVSLIHFVTNRCNARCPFCFIDFDDPSTFAGELTLEEIDKITSSVGPYLENVNLTGGEPFARKDFLDIARSWLKNTNVRSLFITSNGSLTKRMEKFTTALVKEFPGRKIVFSLSIDAYPEEHNKIRKIDGLFEAALSSYHMLKNIDENVMVNIAITVSHMNHGLALNLYNSLIDDYGVEAITATAVRDEGVYRIPQEDKKAIYQTYNTLTKNISDDLQCGRLKGYDSSCLQGRLMNKKNVIVNRIICDTYLEPRYISPCHAGSLFGVISANGDVRPCEILDQSFGNLKEYDFHFMNMWRSQKVKDLSSWIRKTKCHCTYECAWTLNVLGNARYLPKLAIGALFGK